MKRFKELDYTDPNKIALTNYDSTETISYGQLAYNIAKLHSFLHTKGIRKDNCVMLRNDGTSNWVTKLASIATYGAKAVIIPNKASSFEIEYIKKETKSTYIFDDEPISSYYNISTEASSTDIDIFTFSLKDEIIIDYGYNEFGMLTASSIKVCEFMQIAEEIKKRYLSLRHSRTPSMLLANKDSMDATEILASLSIGANITLAGAKPSANALLKCLKRCRPHFVYLDTKTAENMIRERIYPLVYNRNNTSYMRSSYARRTMLKQVRKRMLFALGGCILTVCVTGDKFSPDIESFLQKIDFPYQFV